MNRRVATIAHAAGLVGALLLHLSGTASAATAWRAEPGESRLTFMATQAGAEFEGRFKRFTPQISFDPADLPGSRFVVEVDTRSADTQDGDRDAALASSDFFATDRWPTARFETTGFTDKGGRRFEARGRLTIRDVTRDVLLPFSFTPGKDGRHATLAGDTTIRRLDFGVGQGEWKDTTWVGNEVKVRFQLTLALAPNSP
jgi:polyisoprenoid-binding protein YceI